MAPQSAGVVSGGRRVVVGLLVGWWWWSVGLVGCSQDSLTSRNRPLFGE